MDNWRPDCTPPRDLVLPVPIDPTGRTGPTRHQARRGRWRRTAFNLYVPSDTDATRVEQRIVEQAGRAGPDGAVTGWAALRLWGAAFFDGTTSDGSRLPVSLVSPHHLTPTAESTTSRARIGARWNIAGVPVVGPAVALYAEIQRRAELRSAVAAIDMACAAPVTSKARFASWLSTCAGSRSLASSALALASELAVSPPEVATRLVWVLDAGWPEPLVNSDVFDLEGRFLGRPDLLDPTTGVYGEYDGALHRSRERHRADVDRHDRLQRHGLEQFVIVAGDGPEVQLARMRSARERAIARPAAERRWTLQRPDTYPPLLTAEEKLAGWGIPI